MDVSGQITHAAFLHRFVRSCTIREKIEPGLRLFHFILKRAENERFLSPVFQKR